MSAACPGIIVVRPDVDLQARTALPQALLARIPWDAVYGPFRPFCNADVHSFVHVCMSCLTGADGRAAISATMLTVER